MCLQQIFHGTYTITHNVHIRTPSSQNGCFVTNHTYCLQLNFLRIRVSPSGCQNYQVPPQKDKGKIPIKNGVIIMFHLREKTFKLC